MTYTRRTIVSTLRNLFTLRTRRTPAGTAAASPPWSSWPAWAPPPRRPSSGACPPAGVGAAGALHVQPRPGHPDHPGGGVMRTVEQVVAEIDAAIAGTGPLSPRLGTRPRTRPRTAGAPGRGRHPRLPRVRDVASPCDADTIVMEVIR